MVIEYFMEWVQTAPAKKREEAARAMVKTFLKTGITQEEREDIDAALTVLLDDRSPSVRLAMAEAFGAYGRAPRHIISTLASDTPEIALVVLSRSPVFHDSELIHRIRNGSENEQLAISCRPWISDTVIAAISQYACKGACLGILLNEAIEISGRYLHDVAERFGSDTEIRALLLKHANLEARSRHVLISKLGDSLGGLMREKSWLPEARIRRTLADACDRASIIFAANATEEEIRSVVQNLIETERLTVVFLVRAICMGNISLVACALSELSSIRYSKVETILTGNRESAFRAVYERAGLPNTAFVVFWTAIRTWRRLLASGSKTNQARLPFIVIREVMEEYSKNEDMVSDEMLVLLRGLAAETAREISRAKAGEIARRNQPADAADTVRENAIDVEAEPLPAAAVSSVVANQPGVAMAPQPGKSARSLEEVMGYSPPVPEIVLPENALAEMSRDILQQVNAIDASVPEPAELRNAEEPVVLEPAEIREPDPKYDLDIGVVWDEKTGFARDVDLSSYYGEDVSLIDDETGVSHALLYAPLAPVARAA